MHRFVFKSSTVGAILAALSVPSAAFLPSSNVQVVQRLHLKLAYRQSQVDVNGYIAPAPLSTTNSIPAPKEEKVEASQEFDWFKAWYPVFPVDIFDPEKPTPLELLGMKLVVYNDGAVVNKEGKPVGFGSKLACPKGA